jgi:hypothetical protein
MTKKKLQSLSLWGRAIGRLNKKTTDVALDIGALPDVKLEVFDTSNTARIAENSRVVLIVRKGLIWQRFTCGTRGDIQTPEDVVHGGNTLTQFGREWKNAKWSVEFLEPTESGRKIAWTGAKIIQSETVWTNGEGESLLEIRIAGSDEEDSRAWWVQYDGDLPMVVVNHDLPALKEAFKSDSMLRWMVPFDVFACVLDKLILEHLEYGLDPSSDNWQGQWLMWLNGQGIDQPPAFDPEEALEAVRSCAEWKEEAIKRFTEKVRQVKGLGDALSHWSEESA